MTTYPSLLPHQKRISDAAAAASRRGEPFRQLLYWNVGSGKTIGALSAAAETDQPSTAVVPAAVRPSFRTEAERLNYANYPVVSYEAAAAGKAPYAQTLVIDESQRIGSPASTRAQGVRDLAMGTRNVLMLSGTPIRNRPSEFAPLLSVLTGSPISHDEFARRYIGTKIHRPGLFDRLRGVRPVEEPTIVHTDELRRLLSGKVDYHNAPTPNVAVAHTNVDVELMPTQTRLYNGMIGRLPSILRWKLQRDYQLSARELAAAQSFLHGPRQVALSNLPYRPDGDAYKAFLESGKLQHAHRLLRETIDGDPRTKAIVYSNFPHAGLTPYAAALAKARIPHAIFHGGLSDVERKDLVAQFNDGKIRVALVGPAGAEGISLKGAQLIQELDRPWNEARSEQAIARGIRLDSHRDLPPELRKVRVQHFSAKLPLGLGGRLRELLGANVAGRRETTDDYLQRLAGRKQKLNVQLLDLLKDIGTRKEAATPDRLPGGRADQRPETDFPEEQIEKGIEHEKEHTDDSELASEIARDHLAEDDDYYTKLEKMEKGSLAALIRDVTAVDRFLSELQPQKRADDTTTDDEDRLWVYECPHCGGDAYNGIPGTGVIFRGSAKCSKCTGSFVAVRRAPKSKHGPLRTSSAHKEAAHVVRRSVRELENNGGATARVLCDEGTGIRTNASRQKFASAAEMDATIVGRLVTLVPDTDKWAEAALAPVVWGSSPGRASVSPSTLERLREAKAHSDRGDYAAKTQALREMISGAPQDWRVDSWLNPDYVGITHASGFRYHLPVSQVADLLVLPAQIAGTHP